MDYKVNGHSADYIKRQATKLKKELGIPHHAALDKAAQNAGFANWKNFVNGGAVSQRLLSTPAQTSAPKRPKPLVRTYGTVLSGRLHQRPNAKMPISAHQEIALLLRAARCGTLYNKRAKTPIGEVRTTLDDWVQKEYPSERELPSEIFHAMYFGGDNFESERSPSDERKQELVKVLQRAKSIIDTHYHDCQPVRWIHKKLDLAIKAIGSWPKGKKESNRTRQSKPLAAGTLIRFKSNGKFAIVVKHEEWSDTVELYNDRGSNVAARREVAALLDQSGASEFKPMRLFLPYGKWTCADGTEVLFNRDYCPLWARKPDGTVIALDPDTWVNHKGESVHYFNDGTTPWGGNKNTLSVGLAVLKEWGVENKRSRLLNLLPTAIAAGDVQILRPKNTKKTFPLIAA